MSLFCSRADCFLIAVFYRLIKQIDEKCFGDSGHFAALPLDLKIISVLAPIADAKPLLMNSFFHRILFI